MSGFRIRRIVSAACVGACVCVFLAAPRSGEPGREGAERPGKAAPPKEKNLRAQPYKSRNREQISRIVDGKAEAVIEELLEHLGKYPDDAESLFALTIAYCQAGDVPHAVDAMRRALAAGLPLERFVAGPRRLLEPLTGSEPFQELRRGHDFQLIHGPMVGCVTDASAKIWLRTAEEVPIQVVFGKSSDSADMSRPLRSATVFTEADRDYTAVVDLERLEPDTVYHYDLLIRGKPAFGAVTEQLGDCPDFRAAKMGLSPSERGKLFCYESLGPKLPSFRTFPQAESSARFRVGFGGGAGYTPWKERMWNTVGSRGLAAFLFLGDNVYIDTPTKPEVQRYCYYRRQSRTEYRRFVASTPIFAIWDDHDFGTNDCWYGPEINDPPWKTAVWRVFTENWNNPGYGGGRRQPGCWCRFQIADVDFFMLDGRYYRGDPKGEHPSMLGPAQREWLLDELKHSDAAFKVLASPVPWVLEAKGKSLDTWRGFQAEREEIFSFLEEERVDGVVLISADRHRSDAWRIDREQGYPLYEFESSRLTNVHRHALMPGALFGYNEKCSFGVLSFDTTKDDPEVTYEIVTIDGERVRSFTVRKSEIAHE